MKFISIAISAAALLAVSPAHSASLLKCGSGPLDIHNCPVGPQGPKGENGTNGNDGAPGAKGDTGETGAQGVAGKDGKNGKNGRDGRDFDSDDAIALSAALSPPVWLGDKERVRLSVGTGFTEGAAAVGAAGVVRIDGALAGYAGGAVSTDTGAWAAKVGLSYGW